MTLFAVEDLYRRLTERATITAHCRGEDVELFMQRGPHLHARRKFCENCPGALQCFSVAVASNDIGTWGGVWFGWKDEAGKGNDSRHISRSMIERHVETLSLILGITVDEYTLRFGGTGSVRAYKRALKAIRDVEPF